MPSSKIKALVKSVNKREKSAVDLVSDSLNRLSHAAEYQIEISNLSESALAKAKDLDESMGNGKTIGRLAGVPFIAKDNFLTFNGPTTAASNMLRNFNASYQATAINRLEAEGAICIAKSNMDAWAHGSSTENSDFFVTKNPHDKERVPGGSSGGSAAAVALDIVPFAIGTDTGGSIRQPAAFSGVVGMKPTYGLVSRSGVVAMASSADVIGPLASSVEDAAIVLDIISGKDPLDSTTIDRDIQPYNALGENIQGKKIGIIEEYMLSGLDAGVKKVIEDSLKKLENHGAKIVPVSLPDIGLSLAVYYIICPAEVASNLARYDGLRYGYYDNTATSLDDSYSLNRSIFGAEAKRRIMIGTYVLSSGYYDAYYKKAQTVRTKIIKEFEKAFEKVDFLAGPTTPTPAFKIGEKVHDPLSMYLNDIMTAAANITGGLEE